MARAEQITYNERGEPEGESMGPEQIDADAMGAFDDLRSSLLGTENIPTVWVFRQPTDKSGAVMMRARLGHMFTCPVDQWTMDEIVAHIRDEWMARDATWCVRIQVRQASGKVMWSKLIDINKKPNEGEPRKGAQADGPNVFAEVRQLMADMESRFAERMQAVVVRATPPAPAIDMLAFMKFMTDTQAQSMQTLGVLLTAMRPAAGGANDLMAMLNGMGKIREVAGDLLPAPGGGESDSPLGTMKALAPFAAMLTEFMKKKDGPTVERKTPALAAPSAAPGDTPLAPTPSQATPVASASPESAPISISPAASPPAQPTEAQANMLTELRAQLLTLSQIAGEKPDAKEVAATLLPMLPTEMDDMIYDTLSAENWFDRLCFIQPAIKPHREWMSEVRDAILASYSEVKPDTAT
jgi:hypothetical protein